MRNYQGNTGKVGRNLVLILIAAVVLFMAAVLIGLVLQQRARASAAERAEQTTVPPASDTTPIVPATPITEDFTQKSAFVSLNAQDFSAELFRAGTELSALGHGMTGVCFSAMDAQGHLIYQSAVASSVGHVPSGGTDLAAAVEAAHASGYAVSCLFAALPSAGAEETALRYNAALLAELAGYGVDEVILTFGAAEDPEAIYALLLRYEELLHDTSREMHLGVALPTAVYRNDTAMLSVAKMSGIVDFLAVDFSDIESAGMTAADYQKAAQDAVVSLAGSFDYFDLRAIANGTDPEKNGALLAVLNTMPIDNFMIGKAAAYDQQGTE